MYQVSNFIGGTWLTSEKVISSINPSNGEIYAYLPNDNSVVEEAVTAARLSFPSWKLKSRVERAEHFDKLAQLIKKNHDRLKEAISLETGKSLNESHAEVIEALHMCQVVAASGRLPYGECIASELATKDAYVIRKPRGVVAVISPWNFPAAIGSFWSSAPALVEGNTVVHKPSELTPMVNHIIAQLYDETKFPAGVYNLINGDGDVGAELVRSDVDVILFTGSAEVAKTIKMHCATTDDKTCSVECGSKSATIIFEDGDLNLAVDAAIASSFKLSGQRCVSSGRILVQRSVLDQFLEVYLERVKNLSTGDPFEGNNFYGPLISQEQMAKVELFNEMVRQDPDATVLVDEPREKEKGYFLNPFVYKCEWSDKPFLKQEVFGPHVGIIPFDDIDDAISIYDDTDYGLALGIITDDFRKHRKIAQECTTGMLYVNGSSIGAESHLPFSSWKKSGYGASAAATYKAVTHTMAITVNYEEGKMQFAQGMTM